MGDLLLKQKPPRMSQWQSLEMLSRRPWFPVQPQRSPRGRQQSFNFRPPEAIDYRYAGISNSPYSPGSFCQQNKSRDYCYLTPYYRNAMPPPPNPNRDRLLMVDPSRNKRAHMKKSELSACQCRSKSLDDVRPEIVEMSSEWEEDENGNKITSRRKHNNSNNNSSSNKYNNNKKYQNNRRSMDNLLIDTAYGVSSKRIGSWQ
ncbi:hypothetical protein ILUMI_22101, partial [Ignelater luminosus]